MNYCGVYFWSTQKEDSAHNFHILYLSTRSVMKTRPNFLLVSIEDYTPMKLRKKIHIWCIKSTITIAIC